MHVLAQVFSWGELPISSPQWTMQVRTTIACLSFISQHPFWWVITLNFPRLQFWFNYLFLSINIGTSPNALLVITVCTFTRVFLVHTEQIVQELYVSSPSLPPQELILFSSLSTSSHVILFCSISLSRVAHSIILQLHLLPKSLLLWWIHLLYYKEMWSLVNVDTLVQNQIVNSNILRLFASLVKAVWKVNTHIHMIIASISILYLAIVNYLFIISFLLFVSP